MVPEVSFEGSYRRGQFIPLPMEFNISEHINYYTADSKKYSDIAQ